MATAPRSRSSASSLPPPSVTPAAFSHSNRADLALASRGPRAVLAGTRGWLRARRAWYVKAVNSRDDCFLRCSLILAALYAQPVYLLLHRLAVAQRRSARQGAAAGPSADHDDVLSANKRGASIARYALVGNGETRDLEGSTRTSRERRARARGPHASMLLSAPYELEWRCQF